MHGGFGVHHEHIGTGGLEVGQIAFGLFDHEMHVEEKSGRGAQALDHMLAERHVGHEMAVHHVPVHPFHPSGFKLSEGIGKAAAIGGKEGRGKDHERFSSAIFEVRSARSSRSSRRAS